MYAYPLGPVSSWKRRTLAAMERAAEGFLRAGRLALAFAAQVLGREVEVGVGIVAVIGAWKVNLCDPGGKEAFCFWLGLGGAVVTGLLDTSGGKEKFSLFPLPWYSRTCVVNRSFIAVSRLMAASAQRSSARRLSISLG